MLARSLALGFSSLSAVMAALKQQQGLGPGAASKVPPWRDSPLTRWLKQPLGQAGHVLFLATVAPGLEVTASNSYPVVVIPVWWSPLAIRGARCPGGCSGWGFGCPFTQEQSFHHPLQLISALFPLSLSQSGCVGYAGYPRICIEVQDRQPGYRLGRLCNVGSAFRIRRGSRQGRPAGVGTAV